MMSASIHHILIFSLLLLLLGGANGCKREAGPSGPGQTEKITVAVTPWPASAALFVAQEHGYFGEAGLEARLISYVSGHLALDAVLAGKASLATASETPIARAVLRSKPVAVLATLAEIENGILLIARKDSGVSSPADLRGKKIGLVSGTAADFFLHIYLTTAAAIDFKDVQVEYLATEKVDKALLTGQVDAVSTWAPHTDRKSVV